jgi:hypothetical protein
LIFMVIAKSLIHFFTAIVTINSLINQKYFHF